MAQLSIHLPSRNRKLICANEMNNPPFNCRNQGHGFRYFLNVRPQRLGVLCSQNVQDDQLVITFFPKDDNIGKVFNPVDGREPLCSNGPLIVIGPGNPRVD